MGRHRKKAESRLRRNSVLALTGLIPAGIITVATGAGAHPSIPFLTTASSEASRTGDASSGATTTAPTDIVETLVPEPVSDPPPQPPAPPAVPEHLAGGALSVPAVNFDAYRNAERLLAQSDPGCHMTWPLLAGIGRVESTHTAGATVMPDGTLTEPILGPVLDGSLAGNHVIMDTDGGELDGDPVYDRAVGPMQFLPQTWKRYATDGNGDGRADPQNLYDSAVTTGKYLCDGGLNMQDPVAATSAVLRYNNSAAYVANVLAWSAGYATGIAPAPADLPRIH